MTAPEVDWAELTAEPDVYDDGREILVRNVAGRLVRLLVPIVPETAGPALKEALVRVRIIAMTSECPCGATFSVPDLTVDGRAVYHTITGHSPACELKAADVAQELTKAGWFG